MTDNNWLFAYGSLMWDPGFEVVEQEIATLHGFHRSFCMLSTHYRGTEDCPGLVLALDEAMGGQCSGVALRVADDLWPGVISAVRDRELVSYAYREAQLPLRLASGREINAIGYVMRREHPQYAGQLDAASQARMIAVASGSRGLNREYLYNTASHLAEMGLPDADLEALAGEVRRICG